MYQYLPGGPVSAMQAACQEHHMRLKLKEDYEQLRHVVKYNDIVIIIAHGMNI